MYPPNADDTHCMTMSQIAVPVANAAADVPCGAHGETEENPRPAPNESRTRDTAAATKAPANMAGHDAADLPCSGRVSTTCTMSFPAA